VEGRLDQLVEVGVNVFRCNASHGTPEEHAARIHAVRAAAEPSGRTIGILLDLQGPKIRLGKFENGGCELETGAEFTLTTENVTGNSAIASTTYTELARDVKPGDRILLADGRIRLRVKSTDGIAVKCEVVTGGPVSDRKGINLPGVRVSTPSLTRKDMTDLIFGLTAGIDMVALSFVRRREDVLRLRHFLEEHEAKLPIIAKIEKPEAWERLDEILDESDGVMVARGDLGVEMDLQRVPFIQKSIIQKARERGKFVITATQMLETMIENPFPTRAEVSDVANAIYDGTDAVMLSAETSAGKYPVEAARMMESICGETDKSLFELGHPELPRTPNPPPVEIIALSACRSARTLKASAIVVFTATGTSARLVARHRPPIPILAFTPKLEVARQLSVLYGTRGLVAAELSSTDEMMAMMDREMVQRGWVKPGEMVVFVAGQPIGRPGSTNMMKLHQVRG
jgi:pyruvate kinase